MDPFADLVARMDEAIFGRLAVDAVYGESTPCRVIEKSETLWLQGEESTSARTETTLSFRRSEVNPERGGLVTIGAKTYRLGKQVSQDSSMVSHLVER